MPTLESLKSNFLPGNEKNDGSKNFVRQRKRERESERGEEREGERGEEREGRERDDTNKKRKVRRRTQLDKKLKLDSEPVDLFFGNFFLLS